MDIQSIQKEVFIVCKADFAHKTDKQLWSYQELSDNYQLNNGKLQPAALVRYNSPMNRVCKLSIQQVKEIRAKYIPHVYGKRRLAIEYGVSTTVILRILKWRSWKIPEDPG